MATSVLSRKTGVIVGDDVLKLFNYAQEKKFAIPAIVRQQDGDKKTLAADDVLECHLFFHCRCLSRGCSG